MPEETHEPTSGAPGHEGGPSRRGFLTEALALGGAAGVGIAAEATAGETAAAAKPTAAPVNPRLFSFVGGSRGGWSVVSAKAVVGDPLPAIERLEIVSGAVPALPEGAPWVLRGVTSNERYVVRAEKDALVKRQAALGRPECALAALIPIRKNAKWWALTQEERRAIFEDKSKHIAIGMKYLPAIARRLHHCRDLAGAEPFDFITLFDYAKDQASAFDDLLAALRASEEWKYVDREVDIRLTRA